jgi:hypothetical protein
VRRRRTAYLFLLILAAGCGKQAAVDTTDSISEPVLSRQYRQESITVIVSVSETNITTIGKVQLMLDVQAPPGTEVVFPDVGYFIEPFSISGSYSEPQQLLPNGKILYRQVWILVPELPGEVFFQPLDIAAGNRTITTDPIAVTINSILPAGLETFEIRDIAAPAALLPEQVQKQRRGRVLLGAVILMVFIGAGIHFFRRPKVLPVILPHETAFRALGLLPIEPAPRIHELNRILREYIENRFALPMLGKTTHELLPLLNSTDPEAPVGRIIKFLEAGEQIRFSNIVPDGYAEHAEGFVYEFVESTKQEDPCA